MTPEIEKRLRALLAEQPSPYYSEITRAIGKKVHRLTIKKWCVKLGLPYKPIVGLRCQMTPEIEKRLRMLLAKRPSITRKELAVAMGDVVSPPVLIAWCKKFGLPYRLASRKDIRKLTPEIEQRLRLLVAERPTASYPALARDLQVPSQGVRRWVKRLGLPHHDQRK